MQPPDPFGEGFGDLVAERLLRARTLLVSGEIDRELETRVTAQLLALAAQSSDDITIHLNAYGDRVEPALTIHETIRSLGLRARMVALGSVAGSAVLVYVAAPREDRCSLPHARFRLSEPRAEAGGSAEELETYAREVVRLHEEFCGRIARATGRPFELVEEDCRRHRALSAEEAVEYGLVGWIADRPGPGR